MGREPDDAVVVLRNPVRSREIWSMTFFLPLTVIVVLTNAKFPTWLQVAFVLLLLASLVRTVLVWRSRIVVSPDGVDLRTKNGRRLRLDWAAIGHFAVHKKYNVDLQLISGRRITAMRFAPVGEVSPASTVALLEYERRRLGGAAMDASGPCPTR